MNDLLKNFIKSPLAIGLVALNALLAGGAALFGAMPALIALPLFMVVSGGELVALLSSKSGAKAILAEQDRERIERDTEKIAHAAALRKRLALLRVDDSALKTAIDRIVLTSGLYLDACAKGGVRDPFVEDALAQASETVSEYLKIADGGRVGAMLGTSGDENARPTPGAGVGAGVGAGSDVGADAESDAGARIAQRARALVDGATRTIEERLALPQGGIEGNHTALDEMESRQELEE